MLGAAIALLIAAAFNWLGRRLTPGRLDSQFWLLPMLVCYLCSLIMVLVGRYDRRGEVSKRAAAERLYEPEVAE